MMLNDVRVLNLLKHHKNVKIYGLARATMLSQATPFQQISTKLYYIPLFAFRRNVCSC